MKKIPMYLLLALFIYACGSNITVQQGSFNFLKGVTKLKVEYNYNGMKVGKLTEDQYTKKKVEDYNADEPGKGNKWLLNWKNDRHDRYQPKFEELVNKYLEGKASVSQSYNDAKYTMIVKTVRTEPGFNAAIVRSDALVDAVIMFVETDNPSNVLAQLEIDDNHGGAAFGFDFDAGLRIQESYSKCGKVLGDFLKNMF